MARTAPKLSFETTFRVRGKVVESVMCDCEEEGHIGIRVARRTGRGEWDYSKEDQNSFFDIVAYSTDGAYTGLRPGDWVEAKVTVRGQVARVPTGELERGGINDGHRYEGRVSKAGASLEIDFGTFLAAVKPSEAVRAAVAKEGLRRGNYVESECAVEASVIRKGSREEILGHSRRVFPRRGHA
ncbi:MAG: hypothetical protein A3K65_08540 [Euryarchaeota archaeon RBG_16_68_12]|nr:MAG: hypothetical protein A3K65_08540 [Euryarchaeota archaeon RBG_16_68_12]